MNAEAITNKIIEEARAAAALTLREAGERASRIHMDAEADAEQKRAAAMEQADQQASQMRERMLRMAELDQKKALLTVKRDVIEEVFLSALKRMRTMGEAQRQDYLEQLLIDASEDGEELIADEADRALFDEAYLARLNAGLQKAGKKPVTLSDEVRNLGGGFVLKRGGLEVNCTFESVLGQIRPGLEAEVAAMLFGND